MPISSCEQLGCWATKWNNSSRLLQLWNYSYVFVFLFSSFYTTSITVFYPCFFPSILVTRFVNTTSTPTKSKGSRPHQKYFLFPAVRPTVIGEIAEKFLGGCGYTYRKYAGLYKYTLTLCTWRNGLRLVELVYLFLRTQAVSLVMPKICTKNGKVARLWV